MKKSDRSSPLSTPDIGAVDKTGLVDASNLILDNSIPLPERGAYVAAAVNSPSCFLVGDIAVQLEFSKNGPPLQAVFSAFLKRQQNGL